MPFNANSCFYLLITLFLILRLPVDIYQTAKVSKMLLMMEKDCIPVEYKGKSLSDIQFDLDTELPIENDGDDGMLSLKKF